MINKFSQNSQLTVDVIIPVHNGARFIDRCLESVVGQSIAVNKIFVVNDGSTDPTQLILESWVERDSRVRPIKLPKSGVNAARNEGIRQSVADFVAFLDIDDVWMPRKLELQLKVFRDATDSLGLVYGGQLIINEVGNKIDGVGKNEPVMRGELYQALLHEGNLITGSASNVMIRRDVLYDVGLFDESLTFGEDWDMWIRIAHRYKVDFVDDVTVGICQRPDSTQGEYSFESALVRFRSILTVLMKHSGKFQWTKKMIRQNYRMGFEVWRASGYDYDVMRSIKAYMLKFDGIPDVLVKFHYARYFLLFLRYHVKGSKVKKMLGLP